MTWARRRGAERRFRIVSYQDAPSPPMTPALRERARRAVQVLTPEGRRLEAGRASLYVLARVGYPGAARVLSLPPFSWAVELGYRGVAANRRFLERWLSRDPRRCRAEDRNRVGVPDADPPSPASGGGGGHSSSIRSQR